MFWNYVLCLVDPKLILVEPFHHGIAEIGLKSFSDLFCKLWPWPNSNCKPWTLTNLDLIIIILFAYWIMWWTWTTNIVALVVFLVWLLCLFYFVCCIDIYCCLFILFRVNGVLQVTLKRVCEQRQVYKGKYIHKFMNDLLFLL